MPGSWNPDPERVGVNSTAGASSPKVPRGHSREVPILRRANITFRGWFNLSSVYDRTSGPQDRSNSTAKVSCAALHDPFEGLSGWHTGLNEVRGGGPTTLFDVHCPCLNFAVTNPGSAADGNSRASGSRRARFRNALAKTREAAAQRRAQRSKEMANVKAPKLTREGIKEMLEKASKQADMREKIA